MIHGPAASLGILETFGSQIETLQKGMILFTFRVVQNRNSAGSRTEFLAVHRITKLKIRLSVLCSRRNQFFDTHEIEPLFTSRKWVKREDSPIREVEPHPIPFADQGQAYPPVLVRLGRIYAK